MKKSKIVSLVRLRKTLPTSLRLEWEMFLRFSLTWILMLTGIFPFALLPALLYFGMPEQGKTLGILAWSMLAGACFGGVVCLIAQTISFASFYAGKVYHIFRGKLWTSADSRELQRSTQAVASHPMFPGWVYWKQLCFQVWWAKTGRLMRKLCH